MSRDSAGSAQPADVLPFADVYLLYHDRVYYYCLVQLQGDPAAEDITGDVFTAALAAYDRVRPHRDGVLFWLLRIAKNHALSHLRRQQRFRRALGRLATSPATNLDVEAQVALRDELRRLVAAVSELHEDDRSLIGLRVGREMSYRQIAATAGITRAAAEWATQRALRRAQVAFEALEQRGNPEVQHRSVRPSRRADGHLDGHPGYRPGSTLD